MIPVAGHPPPAHEAKAKAARQKEISVIFHKVFRSGTTTNRDEPAKPEEGVTGHGRKGGAGEQVVGDNPQPGSGATPVGKPSKDADKRQPVQPEPGNRWKTGTTEKRTRR